VCADIGVKKGKLPDSNVHAGLEDLRREGIKHDLTLGAMQDWKGLCLSLSYPLLVTLHMSFSSTHISKPHSISYSFSGKGLGYLGYMQPWTQSRVGAKALEDTINPGSFIHSS
jgi:hypothetical protein